MALRTLHIQNLTQDCISRFDAPKPFWRKSLANNVYRHVWVPTKDNYADVVLLDEKASRPKQRDYIRLKLATCLLDVNEANEECRVLTTCPPTQQKILFNTVFLDPGQKAFQTFYSPEGLCGTIGEGFVDTMYQMAKSHDKLYRESCGRGVAHADQQHMRTRCHMIRLRLRRMIEDLHTQTISFLCNHFNHVFIPPYVGVDITEDYSQILSNKTALSIHYNFSQKLKTMAKTNGTRVYMIGEEFTTKTCGCCGHIQTVGSQRIFNCQKCDLTIDRDLNAARNICLKTLSLLL